MSLSARKVIFAAALVASAVLAQPARADVHGLVGNDTGGIIPWSPFTEQYRWDIAAKHCAWYGKYPHITSVHRQYGDYIGFRCRFGPPRDTTIITRY